jgi:N-acetyl-anhydromuramyl-L-alanine amidase AmpD
MARYTPAIKVKMWSQNKSSRRNTHPTLIVIHATVSHNRPGLADLQAIGTWFQNPAAQASSHVCTDNEGNSAIYVNPQDKAWHCAAYNRMSLGIEQILPGVDGREITKELYQETARWVARWSKMYGIPIRKGIVSSGRVTRAGIVRHSDLGTLGGGHSDPGPYDMNAMMRYAQFYRTRL